MWNIGNYLLLQLKKKEKLLKCRKWLRIKLKVYSINLGTSLHNFVIHNLW